MSRLRNAFEEIIDQHSDPGVDQMLAQARRAVRRPATSLRTASLATAAAIFVIAIFAAVAFKAAEDGGGRETVRAAGGDEVSIFLIPPEDPDCNGATPAKRPASAKSPLEGAMSALLDGPTANEREQGLSSWFSSETSGMLRSVQVEDGVATVDFDDFAALIPNASTSCGSTSLLAQLDATVTQFPEVDRAVYTFDGDADAFYSWLQRETPSEGGSAGGDEEVSVFFSPPEDPGCDATAATPRSVAADSPLDGAISELLDGPTDDEGADGLTSWFSSETSGMLRSVQVEDGVATVDFDDFAALIPNASTSCGSTSLLAQLDATVTQFPEVDRAVYTFDGDADAFYSWLQRETPSEGG